MAFRLIRFRTAYIRNIAPLLSGLQRFKIAFTERPPPLSGHVEIAVCQPHRNIKFIAFCQVYRATRYKQESGALNYAYIRASNNWFKSLAALAGTG